MSTYRDRKKLMIVIVKIIHDVYKKCFPKILFQYLLPWKPNKHIMNFSLVLTFYGHLNVAICNQKSLKNRQKLNISAKILSFYWKNPLFTFLQTVFQNIAIKFIFCKH